MPISKEQPKHWSTTQSIVIPDYVVNSGCQYIRFTIDEFGKIGWEGHYPGDWHVLNKPENKCQ